MYYDQKGHGVRGTYRWQFPQSVSYYFKLFGNYIKSYDLNSSTHPDSLLLGEYSLGKYLYFYSV